MEVEFNYYLHDDFTSYEMLAWLSAETGIDAEDEVLREKIGRPFYEVTLRCKLNTETGKITLLEAKL